MPAMTTRDALTERLLIIHRQRKKLGRLQDRARELADTLETAGERLRMGAVLLAEVGTSFPTARGLARLLDEIRRLRGAIEAGERAIDEELAE